jgi:hypothetical protein
MVIKQVAYEAALKALLSVIVCVYQVINWCIRMLQCNIMFF